MRRFDPEIPRDRHAFRSAAHGGRRRSSSILGAGGGVVDSACHGCTALVAWRSPPTQCGQGGACDKLSPISTKLAIFRTGLVEKLQDCSGAPAQSGMTMAWVAFRAQRGRPAIREGDSCVIGAATQSPTIALRISVESNRGRVNSPGASWQMRLHRAFGCRIYCHVTGIGTFLRILVGRREARGAGRQRQLRRNQGRGSWRPTTFSALNAMGNPRGIG